MNKHLSALRQVLKEVWRLGRIDAESWMDQIGALDPDRRSERKWHYVLLGEQTAKDCRSKNAEASDLLDFVRLRHKGTPAQGVLI